MPLTMRVSKGYLIMALQRKSVCCCRRMYDGRLQVHVDAMVANIIVYRGQEGHEPRYPICSHSSPVVRQQVTPHIVTAVAVTICTLMELQAPPCIATARA